LVARPSAGMRKGAACVPLCASLNELDSRAPLAEALSHGGRRAGQPGRGANETPLANGIGDVLEHMAPKGIATRCVHPIDLDAERLGANVNAFASKD